MEIEVHNSRYGSIDSTKPLIFQKDYISPVQTHPFSEVKYESLNEIHLDFSKTKSYKNSIHNNGSTSNINKNFGNTIITTNNSSQSPKRIASEIVSSTTGLPTSILFNNKNNSSTSHTNNTNNNLISNSKAFTPIFPQINYPSDSRSDTSSSTNTTLLSTNNINVSNLSPSEITSTTEITVDSNSSSSSASKAGNSILSFNLRNKGTSRKGSIQSILETSSPKCQNSHITIIDTKGLSKSNSSSHLSKTPNFKSFKSFERLKDQLERSKESESDLEPTREQIIHNQFSEQFRDDFNTNAKASTFPIIKNDPFDSSNDTKISTSEVEIQDDPFLCPENNESHPNEFVEDFSMNQKKNNNKVLFFK